jgi:hypothetical protein
MKQKITLLFSFAVIAFGAVAQHAQGVGVHLNTLDVNTPMVWKNNSGPKTLTGLSNQDLGFSVSYWRHVYKQVEVSGKVNLMFHDYSAIDRNVYEYNNNQIGVEVEGAANAYAFKESNKYNAFVSAGLGFGSYSKKFGAYVPAGLGLQANFNNETYIKLQSQYRFSLTSSTQSNALFYSIGLVQNIGKKK